MPETLRHKADGFQSVKSHCTYAASELASTLHKELLKLLTDLSTSGTILPLQ